MPLFTKPLSPVPNSHGYGVTHDCANIHWRCALSTPPAGALERRFRPSLGAAPTVRAGGFMVIKRLGKGGFPGFSIAAGYGDRRPVGRHLGA